MKVSSAIRGLVVAVATAAVSLTAISTAAAVSEDGSFDASRQGSITVHKHFGDEGTAGNGTETAVSSPALKGVKFKVEKVTGVDLSTNTGWVEAGKIAKGEKPAAGFEPQGQEIATDDAGKAVFSKLPVGLYKVTETDASAATKNGEPVKVKTSAPFYVTIPLTDPNNRNAWLYDVHVYPKNQEFTVTKTAAFVAGDTLQYTVTASLPKMAIGKSYEKYVLVDQLSVNHEVSSFAVKSIKLVTGADDPLPTTVETDDYQVDTASKADQNRAIVRFTPQGLQKLTSASQQEGPKTQVVYTYTVKVKESFTNGDLTNTAYVIPSNEYDENNPNGNTPGGSNTTKFVKFQIEKQDANETGTKLGGAEFDLYACTAEGKFADAEGKPATEDGKKVKLNKTSVVTKPGTGLSEEIRIPVSGQTNNVAKVCAVETKAPEGYSLLTQPVVFDVNTSDAVVKQTIDNVKANAGFKLPLTGASSLLALSIAGAFVLAGGFVLALRSRKDR